MLKTQMFREKKPPHHWPFKREGPFRGSVQDPKKPELKREVSVWVEKWARMGGDLAVHILTKTITASDVDPRQNRLLLTPDNFATLKLKLTPAEIESVSSKDGLRVDVMDTRGKEFAMRLKYYPDNKGYRIIGGGWHGFVDDNKVESGKDAVELWAFHAPPLGAAARYQQNDDEPGKLWFVLLAKDVTGVSEIQRGAEATGFYDPGTMKNWRVKL